MLNTVPPFIAPQIKTFCLSVAPGPPRYIRSKPYPTATASACFDNVAAKIARAGGTMVPGWAIWTVPGVCFEAEHHGAWRKRSGEIVDLSPQPGDVRRILFLPDEAAPYDPQQPRMNIIRAVDGNPLAAEFVGLANRRNALLHAYREGGARIALLNRSDQVELGEIEAAMLRFWNELAP